MMDGGTQEGWFLSKSDGGLIHCSVLQLDFHNMNWKLLCRVSNSPSIGHDGNESGAYQLWP